MQLILPCVTSDKVNNLLQCSVLIWLAVYSLQYLYILDSVVLFEIFFKITVQLTGISGSFYMQMTISDVWCVFTLQNSPHVDISYTNCTIKLFILSCKNPLL